MNVWLVVLTTIAGVLSFGTRLSDAQRAPDVIFSATPQAVVAAMLDAASVGTGDVLYDLGSGDGRIPIMAAKRGARGVGVEIDPRLVDESRKAARREGVDRLVTFINADLFDIDLAPATVVTLALGKDLNLRLRPKLTRELRQGARVVSAGFDLGDWPPDKKLAVEGRMVFVWRIR